MIHAFGFEWRQVPLKVKAAEPAVGEIQPSSGRVQPNDQIVHFDTASKTPHPWFRPFNETALILI